MTVYDFCYLCTDDGNEICIYDLITGEEVFKGTIDDAMYSEYANYEVQSYDLDFASKYFCLNIDMSE